MIFSKIIHMKFFLVGLRYFQVQFLLNSFCNLQIYVFVL